MVKALLALALAVNLAGASFAQTDKVTAEMLADTTAVTAGKPFTVALHLTVSDGWHVYWINPGDAGAATTFKLTLPPGFSGGGLEYPVPEKLPQPGGLTVYGYERELLLTEQVTPPADLKAGDSVGISGKAGWCVCSDVCVLGKKALTLSLPVGTGAVANAGLFAAFGARMPDASDRAFDQLQTLDSTMRVHWRNVPVGELQWLPGPCDDLNVDAAPIVTRDGWSTIHLKISAIQGISATSSTLSGILAYYAPGKPAAGVRVRVDRSALHVPAAK